MFMPLSGYLGSRRSRQGGMFLLAAFLGAFIVTVSIYFTGMIRGIPLDHLTGDPALITKTPIHIGALSNLGVMLWSSAAAAAFIGAALLHRNSRQFRFLLISGLFSALLGVDDLFTIHEHILPHYLHIPENISYIGYLVLIGFYMLYFINTILSETDYRILGIALLFFGLSVVIPRFFSYSDLSIFIKDSLKFFGIAFWLAYFSFTTIQFVKTERQDTTQAAP